MPPRPRQLHACAGLALRSGIGQQLRPSATRTVNRLPKTQHENSAAADGQRPSAELTAEEPFHAKEDNTDAREGCSAHDSGAEAAGEEEVIVFPPLPAVPDCASACTRHRKDGGAVQTFKRYLRPYDEEDYTMVAKVAATAADAAATAARAEGETDGTAAFPPRRSRKSAAEFYASVWHWSAEDAEPRPHLSAGDDQTSQAESQRAGDTSEHLRDTLTCFLPLQAKKREGEAIPTPATRAAATRCFEGKFKAISAEKRCVVVAERCRAQYASAEEDTWSSSLLLLPLSHAPANRGEVTPAMSSRLSTERCGGRDSDFDEDAPFLSIAPTISTLANEDDGAREDGRGRRPQGALVEREVRSAVPASDVQLAIPKHFSVPQGGDGVDDGEMLRGPLLTAAPLSSSGQWPAVLTHGDSGKFASNASCSIAPRYRPHARYMALRDLWIAPSTTASLSAGTSSSAFLQLFTASPLSHSADYEVDAEATSWAPDKETDATSRMWSIIMAYYAAHHAPQAPRPALLERQTHFYEVERDSEIVDRGYAALRTCFAAEIQASRARTKIYSKSMNSGCSASVVEVRIGHVIIPRASAAASAAVLPSVEPAQKRARTEALAAPANVVTAAAWSEEAIAEALRQYALAALAVASCEAVESKDSFPSAAAVAAVLKVVRHSASSGVAGWPAVRFSPTRTATDDTTSEGTKSFASGWSAVSFSFVFGVLHSSGPASSEGGGTGTSGAAAPRAASAVDATTLRVLAAIPLPRGLCVPYQATSAETKTGSCAGCVSAVLIERIPICASAAIPPPVLSSEQHSPTSRPTLFPCMDGVLPAELRAKPLLIVGAGGIGCEVLKVLVLSGFTEIHLIDLDTIDATNLNRQFLFQAADVGRPKADTARRVVLEWFAAPGDLLPDRASALRDHRMPPCIEAYHDNVTADRYDDAFYRQFAVVLSALDNVSARQHVNRMCMRNNIPLIESGTMGYNGQVQPILKDVFECYDCRPKPPEAKTFAVCTIHARPTTMVHCVHYAKELYEALFGGDSSDTDGEVASALTATGVTAEAGNVSTKSSQEEKKRHGAPAPSDGGELSYLRSMISEWRRRLSTPLPGCTGAATCSFAEASSTLGRHHAGHCEGSHTSSAAALAAELLRLLFVTKVEELLSMKAFWPTQPPEPLSRRDIDRIAAAHMSASIGGSSPTSLSGDDVLSVQDAMELFLRAVTACLARPGGLPFEKDDDVAVRFVCATANMRAHVFHIAGQSLEEVRSIAGSIVPAIATTNATIAGAAVHELISLLRSSASPPGSRTVAQLSPLSKAELIGESAPAAVQTLPRAHVVYARKAPQLRRRRVPRPTGQQHFAPALFMEYAGDGAPSSNEGAWNSATHYAPLQAALACVGAEHSTVDPRHLHSAAKGDGQAGRSAVVMDHYLVHSTVPNPPSRLDCLVCQDVHPEVFVSLNLRTATLGQFVHCILEDALGLEAPSVSYGPTLLYEDEDYEALTEHMLAEVLQLAPAKELQVAHRRQSYALTADALNKDVSWSVVLIHADMEAAAPTQSPPAVLFEVSGLEQAEVTEERALARLAVRQERRDEEVDEGSRRASLGMTALASPAAVTTAPVAADVIISDDDEALDEVPAKNGVSGVAKEDAIIVLD